MDKKKLGELASKLLAVIYAIGLFSIIAGIFLCIFFPTNFFVLRLFGDRKSGLYILLFIGFLYFIFVTMIVNSIHRVIHFSIATELTANVKVISKSYEVSTPRVRGIRIAGHTTCFVAFEFPNGDRKNFAVDTENYNTILENEIGVLTYKAYDTNLFFVGFKCRV